MQRKSAYYILFLLLLLSWPGITWAQDKVPTEKPDRFAGVGISVDIDSAAQLPYIVEVLSGKPGAMAGLRSGDYILAINRWKAKGQSKYKVISHLRGMAGSTVTITVKRGEKTVSFAIKREHIVVLPQPENLCEALDTLLKSALDSFAYIKGRVLKEPDNKNQPPDYVWQSALKLPRLGEAVIIKKYDSSAYLKSLVYVSKDSIQAASRYQRIVDDLRDCLPYSVADGYQERPYSYGVGYYTSFIVRKFKGDKYRSIKGVVLTVLYEHFTGQPAVVHLIYRFED